MEHLLQVRLQEEQKLENSFSGPHRRRSIAMVKLKPAKNYLKEFFAIAQDAVCYQENDIMLGTPLSE